MGFYDQNNQGWPTVASVPAYGWQPQTAVRQPTQTPITNIEFVTSLNEALIKTSARGSDMLYMDQNRPVLYRVRVNEAGIKSYLELPYTLPDQLDNTPATKADIRILLERIEALEKAAPQASVSTSRRKKVEEVVTDGESNG